MIYLDTCVLIYSVQREPYFGPLVKRAVLNHPDVQFAISPLVEMECLVGPLKDGDATLEAAFRRAFVVLTSLDVARDDFEAAARLRAHHSLKTADALHLAIAKRHGCEALWTNDDRLSKAAPGYAVDVRSLSNIKHS